MSEVYYYPEPTEEITQKLYDSLLVLCVISEKREGISELSWQRAIKEARKVLMEAEEYVEAPGDDYERNG